MANRVGELQYPTRWTAETQPSKMNAKRPGQSRPGQEVDMELLIKLTWDPEACVWVAESDDVPDLVLESGSFDALIERVRFAVPELLALNGTAAPSSGTERETTISGITRSPDGTSPWMERSSPATPPTRL